MGIKGLTPFLKKFAPSSFTVVNLSEFANKRIGVDISLFLYKYKIIYGEQWLSGVLELLTTLRSFSIHPIVIFDGEAPIEKMHEQECRRNVKEERKNMYDILSSKLETYKKTGVISSDLQSFYDKQMVIETKRNFATMAISKFDANVVTDKLERIKNQNVRVIYNDIELVQDMVKTLCIPYFQAPSEAEAMCSWLTRYNILDGVLTEDTDVLAYGAKMYLSKLNISTNTCTLVDYSNILKELQLTEEQFTELCIMCGCDYNQRIKGIGPVRILKILRKYSSIDNFIKSEGHKYADCEILNHKRIKQLFTTPDESSVSNIEMLKDSWCTAPKFDNIYRFMTNNNCMIYVPQHVYNCCLQNARVSSYEPSKVKYTKRRTPTMK